MIQPISNAFKWFFKLEAASGLMLLFTAVLALVVSNSDLNSTYIKVLNTAFFRIWKVWN